MINVTSQTGTQPPTVEASSYYGSFGTALRDESHWRRWRRQPRRRCGLHGLNQSLHHPWLSRSQRRAQKSGERPAGVRINDVSKLTLLLNSVDIKANDAGGLTADEWRDNPRQSPRGDQYNTRKNTRQTQPACAMSASSVPVTISAL